MARVSSPWGFVRLRVVKLAAGAAIRLRVGQHGIASETHRATKKFTSRPLHALLRACLCNSLSKLVDSPPIPP
jgi:hypothetical protein